MTGNGVVGGTNVVYTLNEQSFTNHMAETSTGTNSWPYDCALMTYSNSVKSIGFSGFHNQKYMSIKGPNFVVKDVDYNFNIIDGGGVPPFTWSSSPSGKVEVTSIANQGVSAKIKGKASGGVVITATDAVGKQITKGVTVAELSVVGPDRLYAFRDTAKIASKTFFVKTLPAALAASLKVKWLGSPSTDLTVTEDPYTVTSAQVKPTGVAGASTQEWDKHVYANVTLDGFTYALGKDVTILKPVVIKVESFDYVVPVGGYALKAVIRYGVYDQLGLERISDKMTGFPITESVDGSLPCVISTADTTMPSGGLFKDTHGRMWACGMLKLSQTIECDSASKSLTIEIEQLEEAIEIPNSGGLFRYHKFVINPAE